MGKAELIGQHWLLPLTLLPQSFLFITTGGDMKGRNQALTLAFPPSPILFSINYYVVTLIPLN